MTGYADAPTPAPPTSLGVGLSASATYPAATSTAGPDGVSLDVNFTVSLLGLPLAGNAPSPAAEISVAIDVYRAGGWLSGGPQGAGPTPGVSRLPALRRAQFSANFGLGGTAKASAGIKLIDGSALGVTQSTWALDADHAVTPAGAASSSAV